MTVPALTGLVLAGGAGRRMGRDKALIEMDGQRLVDRACSTLEELSDRVLVAAGDRRIPDLRFQQIPDAIAGAGPLSGIVAGLERAATPLVAVLAVDLPLASAAVYGLLVRGWDGEPAVVPRAGGRLQPLHAVYATVAATQLRRLLDEGERSPTRALEKLHARVVEPDQWRSADPAGAFVKNLNTPADAATF